MNKPGYCNYWSIHCYSLSFQSFATHIYERTAFNPKNDDNMRIKMLSCDYPLQCFMICASENRLF
jgi:hypothetical protein